MVNAQLIHTSSEAEWLEARRSGVTASEIAVVMGLSPYSSPYALYHQKLGNLPPTEQSEEMALGQYMEEYVAARFADRHPEFTVTGNGRDLFAHPDRPWQMATPDRFVTEGSFSAWDAVSLLECKIDGGSDEWGDEGSDEIPVHYRCQGLWQMDVMDVTCCDVACLDWQRRKVRFYQLTMDDAARADLKLMREEARCFLDRIDLGDEPDVDWRPATREALKHLHPSVEDTDVVIGRQLAISYRAACRRYKAAEKRKDEMTNRLLAAIGGGRRAIEANTDKPVAARQVYDVKESVRKAYTVNKLVPARAPKEHTA